MNKENGQLGDVAIVDPIETETEETRDTQPSGDFYDTADLILQPAREDLPRHRSWKRKLIGWSFILLLTCVGLLTLYFLMKTRRVNVTVQANSRSRAQNTPTSDEKKSENTLTAEAINMARSAAGVDATASAGVSAASKNAAPTPSPDPSPQRNLTFTGSSPVFEQLSRNEDAGSANVKADSHVTGLNLRASPENPIASEQSSGANRAQTIFVDDEAPKMESLRQVPAAQLRNNEPVPAVALKSEAPVPILPPFGTMLPVRTQGVIFTLRKDSYARLELTRDSSGPNWSLSKGTVIVGRTSGSEQDRAFINIIGYIDPRENKLVKMGGEVLGSDGASGIPGKRLGPGRNRLKETLRKVVSGGLQVATSMAGALTGRGTVVVDSAGYRLLNPVSAEVHGFIGAERMFVKVEAGQTGYVMVSDLPKQLQGVDAPGEQDLGLSLTDREVMELILFGSNEEIHWALPLMTAEQQQLTLKTTAADKDKP